MRLGMGTAFASGDRRLGINTNQFFVLCKRGAIGSQLTSCYSWIANLKRKYEHKAKFYDMCTETEIMKSDVFLIFGDTVCSFYAIHSTSLTVYTRLRNHFVVNVLYKNSIRRQNQDALKTKTRGSVFGVFKILFNNYYAAFLLGGQVTHCMRLSVCLSVRPFVCLFIICFKYLHLRMKSPERPNLQLASFVTPKVEGQGHKVTRSQGQHILCRALDALVHLYLVHLCTYSYTVV